MIEHNIRDFLRDVPEITQRVEHRIRPGRLEQSDSGEAIVLQEVSRTPEVHLGGEVGLHDVVLQVKCYSDTAKAAFTLAELVRNRLSGYRGPIGDQGEGFIQSTRIIASGADEEDLEDDSDEFRYTYRWDFAMHTTETIPTFS